MYVAVIECMLLYAVLTSVLYVNHLWIYVYVLNGQLVQM